VWIEELSSKDPVGIEQPLAGGAISTGKCVRSIYILDKILA
jgi:hypothetical protein